jgi:hypothetical protein
VIIDDDDDVVFVSDDDDDDIDTIGTLNNNTWLINVHTKWYPYLAFTTDVTVTAGVIGFTCVVALPL